MSDPAIRICEDHKKSLLGGKRSAIVVGSMAQRAKRSGSTQDWRDLVNAARSMVNQYMRDHGLRDAAPSGKSFRYLRGK